MQPEGHREPPQPLVQSPPPGCLHPSGGSGAASAPCPGPAPTLGMAPEPLSLTAPPKSKARHCSGSPPILNSNPGSLTPLLQPSAPWVRAFLGPLGARIQGPLGARILGTLGEL